MNQSASAASSVVGWGYNGHGQTTAPNGLSNVVAIAAGTEHSLALTAEGQIVGWGNNYLGQTNIPSELSNVVAIDAREHYSLALTADGQVVGWGANEYGETTIPSGLSNVVAIAAGCDHSLALTVDRHVVGWGYNGDGQATIPSGLSNVVAIAAGGDHSLALTADGWVVGWGDNDVDQTTIPDGLSNVVAIAAGRDHSLALTADGQVVGWGANYLGQTKIPSGLSNVVAIAAGDYHSLALTADGQVVGWGSTENGQTTIPSGLSNVVAIAAGNMHSLALIRLPAQSGPPFIIGPRLALATADRFFRERIVTVTTADGYGASELPPELTVDTMTGLITGIPSAPGTYSVTLYATNVSGVAQRTLAFYVNAPMPGLLGDLVYWNQGRGFYYQAATNPEWLSAVGLPPGLALDAQTGVIYGIPISQGDFLVNLTVSNRFGFVMGTLTIRVGSPVVGWGSNYDGKTTIPGGASNVVAIAAGGNHSLALTADGQVVGWGGNYYGQTNIPGGLSNAVAIAAGWGHSLALTAEGRVVGWGYNVYGQTNIPSGLSNVVAIAAGGNHSLALTADGQVVGWGGNYYGQTTIPSGLSNVVGIAAGAAHSLALAADGWVVGWGWNDSSQTTIPSGLSNVVAIAAGVYHSLALTADSQVIGWGDNYYGQTTIPRGLNNAVAIAAGSYHSLARTADGQVVGWGANLSGQTMIPNGLNNVVAITAGGFHNLGLLGLPAESGPPLIIGPRVALATVDRFFRERIVTGTIAGGYGANGLPPGLTVDTMTGLITGIPSAHGTYVVTLYATNVTGVAERTLAFHVNAPLPRLSDFVYWNQGRGFYYQAATNSEWASAVGLPPGLALDAQTGVIFGIPLAQGDFPVSLTASNRYDSVTGTLTIRIASPIVGWGNYEIGGGPIDGQTTSPVGLSNVVAIAVGSFHSLALTADGQVVGWGWNGQTTIPSGLSNVVAVAAGEDHSLALTADGQVVGWGGNDYGQTTIPSGLSNVVGIAAGAAHSLALTAEGRVVGWGYNVYGQTTIPSGSSNVVAIAAGGSHSLALTADGQVVGWGGNDSGQTTIPSGLSNVVGIAAGAVHSLALAADGWVVGWGWNESSQTTIPSGLSNVVAIAAGVYHSLALTVDGHVVGWGDNSYAQTTIPSGLNNAVAIAAGNYHNLARIELPGELVPFRPVRGPGYLALTVQPVSRTIVDGANLELVVMAVGEAALSYQWQRDGANVVSATGNRLPFINAQPADSGNYTVIVSNASGAVTSLVARLTVLQRPRLLELLPPKVFAAVGSNVTFTANATGTPPLRYQWRKNGANIQGATNATFTIPNAQISDGGSYTVVVANDVGIATSDPTLLIVLVPAQPAGDDFAQRVVTSGMTNSVGATNFFATKEPDEPNHGGKPGGKSVWYAWRAPTNGIATFRTSGSVFDTLVGIYRGTDVTNLSIVAGDEDRGGFYTSEASFNAVAGADYQIAVDGFAGAAGDFVLSWELEPTSETLPVITNQPVGRVAIPGSAVTFTAGATGAGLEYQWLFNGAVLNGATAASLTLNNVQRANVGFYSVRVRNSFAREVESLSAALELGGRPGGRLSEDKLEDLFNPPGAPPPLPPSPAPFKAATAGSFLVSLGSIDYRVVNNTGSSIQQREPAHCSTIGNATRWVLLQPAADGTFVIDTRGSAIATVLAVYATGATAFDFPQVACDDDGTADGSRVRFSAMANGKYYVVADGANYAKGLIELNWQFGVPPSPVTNAPVRHRLRPGDGVVLQAPTTNGIPLPHFRWFWNGRPLAGQASASLVLSQLQLTNSGYYTVEVDNGIGAVTYTTQVEVQEPLLLSVEPQLSQGTLRLNLPAVTNAPGSGEFGLSAGVMLEVTIDIGNPLSWRPVYLHTNQVSGTTWETPTTNALQFFRARRWP